MKEEYHRIELVVEVIDKKFIDLIMKQMKKIFMNWGLKTYIQHIKKIKVDLNEY